MRVLQICHKPPKPSIDGGCIVMHNISQGLLNNNCKLKIITISTIKHPLILNQLDENYKNKTGIEGLFVDTKPHSCYWFHCSTVRHFFTYSCKHKI